ncbi:MAG TPA: hypothetical protein VKM93_10240 [Terriglobia bacterium]|nr:hypothetical protein [Terriglobia bacterium]
MTTSNPSGAEMVSLSGKRGTKAASLLAVVFMLMFLLSTGARVARAQIIIDNWSFGNGFWNDPSKWDNGVPNNGGGNYYDVVINGSGSDTITFFAGPTTIDSLTLGTGETLTPWSMGQMVGEQLTVGSTHAAGTLTNNGTLNWASVPLTLDITAGNGAITNTNAINLTLSNFTINASGNFNTATLNGGGTITLSMATIMSAAGFFGNVGTEVLDNVDNTIQGDGNIENLSLINESGGTINANTANPLYITMGQWGFTNNGTVKATGAGGLYISSWGGGFGATFTNNGTIDINASSLTLWNNFNPNNGTLTVENGSTAELVSMENYAGITVDHSNVTVDYDYYNESGSTTIVKNGASLGVVGESGFGGNFRNEGDNATVVVSASTLNVNADFSNTGNNAFVAIAAGSTLNVGGDFNNTGSGASVNLSNGSTGTITGSLLNGATVTVDNSMLTVKTDFNNQDSASTTVQDFATLNVGGNFNNTGQNANVTLSIGGILNVTGTFTNGATASLTLSGPGNIANLGAFQNNGYVRVDTGSVLNDALLNLDGSGTLTGGTYSLNGGKFNYSNSTDIVTNNATLILNANGGTLGTDPNGSTLMISHDGVHSALGGLTTDNGSLTLMGVTQNVSGALTINAGGQLNLANSSMTTGGDLTVNGSVTLNGNDTLTINGALINNAGATFIENSNDTVSVTKGITQNGTFELLNGSKFLLNGIGWTQLTSAGELTAGTYDVGGIFQYGSPANGILDIKPGVTIDLSANGLITPNGSTDALAGLEANEGNLEFDNLTHTETITPAGGTLTNSGTLTLGGTAAETVTIAGTLSNTGTVNLTGPGVTLNDDMNNSGAINLSGNNDTQNVTGDFNNQNGGSLSLTANMNSVSVSGNSNNSAGASVTMSGTKGSLAATLAFINGGKVTLSGVGDTLSAASFTNTGNVSIGQGQFGGPPETVTVGAAGTYTQTAAGASTTVDGALIAGSVSIQAGALLGAGTIVAANNGTVTNSGGKVEPGSPAGNPGTLTMDGNYKQGAGGTLTIDLAGIAPGQFGVLNVSGLATLDGTVDFTAVNGFTPDPGDDFTFLFFGTKSGNFASMDFTNWACPADNTCTDVFGQGSLTLEITPVKGSPTPEPSTWLLLGTALLAMAAYVMMQRHRTRE